MKLKWKTFGSSALGVAGVGLAAYFGDVVDGDFIAYRRYFSEPYPAEPGFYLVNVIFSMFLRFEAFFILIGLLQLFVLSKLRAETNSKFFLHIVAIFYLISMGLLGHWRQSIASLFVGFIGISLSSFIFASVFHYSFLLQSVFYFFRKISLVVPFVIALFILIIVKSDIVDAVFFIAGRERFLSSIRGEYLNMYYEHRNLYTFDNIKMWVSFFVLVLYYADRGKRKTCMFVFMPYFSYVVLGFDAYLAQKSYMALSFLAPYGIAGFRSIPVRRAVSLVVLLDLGSSGVFRFLGI